jgi:ribose transport system substrate-binding protein
MRALAKGDKKTLQEMLPNHGKPDGDLFDTGIKVVLPDSGSGLKPESFDDKAKSIKGYTLSQFNDWLKKYNLTGS